MTTSSRELTRTEAVRGLYDGLLRLRRAMRSRSGDWGHVARDLTRGDIVTLGVVERGGSIRPGHIAATLGVDPSVVSRQLATLSRLGLVERGTDPLDGRAELITVTSQGRRRLLEARDAICDALALRLTGWDPETIARAAALVDDLTDLLHDDPDPTDTAHVAETKETHA